MSRPARERLQRCLRAIDRRLRTNRLLAALGPGLLALAILLLIRDLLLAGSALDLGELGTILWVALAAGVAALAARALRSPDLSEAAAHGDRRGGLNDLLLSAWSLGRRRRPVDVRFLELLERRAVNQAEELDPRAIVPIRVPGSAYVGAFLLVLWIGWVAVGAQGLLPPSLLAALTGEAGESTEATLADLGDAAAPDAPTTVDPEALEPFALATRQLTVAGVLDLEGRELDGSQVAGEIGEGSAATADLDGNPRSETASAGEDQAGDGAQQTSSQQAGMDQEGDDILQELRRESGEESAAGEGERTGADSSQQGPGEGARGDRQAQTSGESGEGEGDPNAPVQEVDFPLAQSAQARSSEDGEPGQSAGAGSPSEDGATARDDGGGTMANNPFGSSTGPQSGAVDPFGAATELEVTLELAILEQQKREQPEPSEQLRRASPQKSAEVARSGARARSSTESESPILPTKTPWRFRGLSKRFFAPKPEPRAGSPEKTGDSQGSTSKAAASQAPPQGTGARTPGS